PSTERAPRSKPAVLANTIGAVKKRSVCTPNVACAASKRGKMLCTKNPPLANRNSTTPRFTSNRPHRAGFTSRLTVTTPPSLAARAMNAVSSALPICAPKNNWRVMIATKTSSWGLKPNVEATVSSRAKPSARPTAVSREYPEASRRGPNTSVSMRRTFPTGASSRSGMAVRPGDTTERSDKDIGDTTVQNHAPGRYGNRGYRTSAPNVRTGALLLEPESRTHPSESFIFHVPSLACQGPFDAVCEGLRPGLRGILGHDLTGCLAHPPHIDCVRRHHFQKSRQVLGIQRITYVPVHPVLNEFRHASATLRYQYRQPRRHRLVDHKPPRFTDARKNQAGGETVVGGHRIHLLETREYHVAQFLSPHPQSRLQRSTTDQDQPPSSPPRGLPIHGIGFKHAEYVLFWCEPSDK